MNAQKREQEKILRIIALFHFSTRKIFTYFLINCFGTFAIFIIKSFKFMWIKVFPPAHHSIFFHFRREVLKRKDDEKKIIHIHEVTQM